MFKIAYCAGHHLGNSKGVNKNMGFGSIREWTLNDRVADHFAEAAAAYEDVELLRTDDPTGETLIDIPERCNAANQWGADVYIDMHHNGGIDGGTGGGVVAYSYPGSEKGEEYRDAIYEAVITAGGLRGNRTSPTQEKAFSSLKLSHMPAVLMEYGFMDSKTDTPVIITDAYSKLVAYATMEGIAKVAGLKKKAAEAESGVLYRVQVGAYSARENAEEMLQKLKADGYDGFVVAEKAAETKDRTPGRKSIDALAMEVIQGLYGSGEERRGKLGDQYESVQERVNEMLKK